MKGEMRKVLHCPSINNVMRGSGNAKSCLKFAYIKKQRLINQNKIIIKYQ